ncbi:type VII secretion-associated serine protease mycosin [Micromonospora psammae]|uniref:type VII secretion-associated serine protease mycosin n=1 Tax=Micromonospora sp. CPCC 205556 TaxID=3122398 RepID=UPI002FF1AC17
MRHIGRFLLGALVLPATIALSQPAVAQEVPNGDGRVRDDQWHLRYLQVQKAHLISRGAGAVVAVPDTGVAPHPDLRRNLLAGTDMIRNGGGDGRQDQDSHGTGMAGLIAAHGRGNTGALGIAPEAKILPIRIKQSNEQGNQDDLISGIKYAVSQGADVISISATTDASAELQQAIASAVHANTVIVAGAGNQPRQRHVGFPAAYPAVIAVGGVDRAGERASVAVTGPEIDVVAPAVEIYSTSIDGKYRQGTGTSDSTAIVAGAVALLRSKYPYLPAEEIVHRLTATAIDKGPPGRDDEYGYGVIDLVAALTTDVPPIGFESPSASPPAGGGMTSTAVAASRGSGDGATTRGLVTLAVIVAAGGAAYALVRRRRRADDPPPRMSR